MKTLLLALTFAACSLSTQAQSITNLVAKFTVNGTTNATLTLDGVPSKKDAALIAGTMFAYGSYVTAQGTNAVVAYDSWLKQNYKDFIMGYAVQKQQADNAALLVKLTALLTANTDLLTAGDLTSLNTIAAKAP